MKTESFASLVLLLMTSVVMGEPEVETSLGTIMGMSTEFQATNLSVFLGIPYAKPPVGRLRFRPPVPVEAWQGTLNATEFGDMCPQNLERLPMNVSDLPHARVSEDCLTLNVYAPVYTAGESLRAVMVFIHGGGFQDGTALIVDGSAIAATQNVVFVIMNFRLGALGFLSTMDAYARGNFGLLDQQLAIQWVKDNIDSFGGDPNKITVFGDYTGGVSVGLQMLSPSNNGLFQRGITQSGVGSSMYLAEEPVHMARRLGSALNCDDIENHRKLVSCLRSKSWQDIQANTPTLSKRIDLHAFMPVVDGEFLPDAPENLAGPLSNFSNFDSIIGFTSNEYKFVASMLANSLTPKEFEEMVGLYIRLFFEDDAGVIQKAVANHYTSWKTPSDDQTRFANLVKFHGDHLVVTPAVQTALRHSVGVGKTYLYQFSHDDGLGFVVDYPAWLEGSSRGSDVPYFLGFPHSPARQHLFTEEQRNLSTVVMTYWANFAKTGNPSDGEPVDVTWPEFTQADQQYLDLDLVTTVDDYVKADDVAFWMDYVPFLVASSCQPPPTDCITTVAEDLGLSLTLSQTSTLIQAFLIAIIVLVVSVMVLCGALCGYRAKVKNMGREYNKLNNLNERRENVADSLDKGDSNANGNGIAEPPAITETA